MPWERMQRTAMRSFASVLREVDAFALAEPVALCVAEVALSAVDAVAVVADRELTDAVAPPPDFVELPQALTATTAAAARASSAWVRRARPV